MNWTAYMKDKEIVVSDERLRAFAEMYVGNGDLASRISRLLWMDAYVMDLEFGVGTHEILEAIKNVEAGEPQNGVKPATQFTRKPLKGLWHKHFFSAHFLTKNISLAHGKNGVKSLVEEIFDPSKPTVTEEMIEELAHRVVHEALEKRGDDGKLTGEWVVFLKHDGKNYYLCLNTHDAGDQNVHDRIMQLATTDFPDLPAWKDAAAQAIP